MLAVVLLLVATQLVSVLLVAEHHVTISLGRRATKTAVSSPSDAADDNTADVRHRGLPMLHIPWVRGTPAPPVVALLRFLLLGLVVAAVAMDWAPLTWGRVVVWGVIAECLAAAAILSARWSDTTMHPDVRGAVRVQADDATRQEDAKRPDDETPQRGAVATEVAPSRGTSTPATGPTKWGPLAIGASGGGIRATAFALGGIHALQDHARELDADAADSEPAVFAVSGGSYMGAALALRRRFARDGSQLDDTPPWTETYRPGSSELERLRRHTRYLFEPVSRYRDGLVSLALGATLNLVVVGLLLLFLTWVSAILAVAVGFVATNRDSAGRVNALQLAPGWDTTDWLALLSVPFICLVVVIGLTIRDWRMASVFDDADPGQEQRAHTVHAREQVAHWRPLVLALAVGWGVLVAGLPAAAVGVTTLTTNNQPVTTVAAVLNGLGFGIRGMCEEGMSRNISAAVDRVSFEARISPEEARSVDAGACGYETEVSRTLATQGDTDRANDVLLGADDEAARGLASNARVSAQIGGISALFLTVVGLLRRGPSPEAVAEAKLFARLKRKLLTWLPLAIVTLVAIYLQLLWMFHYLIELQGPFTSTFVAWSAGLTAVACLLAYLVDANATSLHSFYRARLANAFCVGVDADGRADELPKGQVYRFSELNGAGLNIVATLNSKAANQAPTMRGGFPMVFGPQGVRVFREEGRTITVPMREYEDFAGAGRTSVMAAVAISGAAISPLMGRFGIQVAPYRLLLTLFNLRVGSWVRNPLHAHRMLGSRPKGWLWLTSKPGLAQIAVEAAGRLSADARWIYLSDGGHLDNTGLVECVRHCVASGASHRVLVLDASNDPPESWSAVGDAIAVVRADLDLDLQRQNIPDGPPWLRRYADPSGLEVIVVKSVRVDRLAEGATGTDWNAVLPPNVQSFQLINKDFPRAPTARQKFGDLEFEAYRGLGYAATLTSMRKCDWIAPPS